MVNIEHIEARLKAVGLSANAASQAAGFGRDYLRDILRERVKDPSYTRLVRLAEVLQCTPEYLRGDTEEPGGIMLFTSRTGPNQLPVSGRLRPGYFVPGGSELAEPYDWAISPIGVISHFEWLEYVQTSPDWGVRLEEGALIHVVGARDGIREGRHYLFVQQHPNAELFRRGVFKTHILEPGSDDYVSLLGNETASKADFLAAHASEMLSGRGGLAIQVLGEVVAQYTYFDEGLKRQLREKSRGRD